MRRLSLLLIAALLLGAAPAVSAESESASVAAKLSVDVSEVVSGGTWVEGTGGGYYRTVSVVSFAPEEMVEIYLQWVGWRAMGEPLTIISSVPLKEVNERKLFSASISLETDTPNVTRITVAGQDGEGRADALMVFQATTPGRYQVLPPEPVKEPVPAAPIAPLAGKDAGKP